MHYILLIAMKTMHRAVQKEWRKENEKSERKGRQAAEVKEQWSRSHKMQNVIQSKSDLGLAVQAKATAPLAVPRCALQFARDAFYGHRN